MGVDRVTPVKGGEVFNRLKEINPKVKILLSSGYSINGRRRMKDPGNWLQPLRSKPIR